MVQKRIRGLTINEFVTIYGTIDIAKMFRQAHEQERRLGFYHNDISVNNIMVDENTGEFLTLIDWDMATRIQQPLVKVDRRFPSS